mgnify:CR=1 FL=1
MKITPVNDKWYVNAGRVTREQREQMMAWCHENWPGGWGEADTLLAETVFIFPQLSQANWFILKWA